MAAKQTRWAELRAKGRWVELWADIRATGTVDDLLALDRDLSPEERSADNAARQALVDSPAIRARLDTIADRRLDRVLDRIEQVEGPHQRELAEAGRMLALADGRAGRQDQPA
ncbi:MAG: hypothetical protein GY926_18560 [bacterium]|nr:hypothetical protein [Actinomycetes bacterium]MCP4967219.1 hypothetical protein [bacterium]